MKIIAAFAVGLALASALSAAPAQAQNQHSFVSSQGNDANPCTLAAPCRHLQAALTATISGGEIAILDTAGYNGGATVTITQAVSIVNPGGFEAAIAPPSGGIGIVINAGTNDAVSLRGLSIDGAGVGARGIQFNTGASLTVENCVIRHVVGVGLLFEPSATSSLSVSNSLMADNSADGIYVRPTGSNVVTAMISRVQTNHNGGSGIDADGSNSTGTLQVAVYDSIAAGNIANGIIAVTSAGQATTTLMLFHSVSANNSTGFFASGLGALLRVSSSMSTGNFIGWGVNTSGVLQSYGNNSIDGNTSNETAPPSTALK